jgi:hypothetical protein
MNTARFTNDLETLLRAWTNPAGVSDKQMDKLSDLGTEAGNRLGASIRRIKRNQPGALAFKMTDGGTVKITVERV